MRTRPPGFADGHGQRGRDGSCTNLLQSWQRWTWSGYGKNHTTGTKRFPQWDQVSPPRLQTTWHHSLQVKGWGAESKLPRLEVHACLVEWHRLSSPEKHSPNMILKGHWGPDFKGTESETGSSRMQSGWHWWRQRKAWAPLASWDRGTCPLPPKTAHTTPRVQRSPGPLHKHPNLWSRCLVPRWSVLWGVLGINSLILRTLKLQKELNDNGPNVQFLETLGGKS